MKRLRTVSIILIVLFVLTACSQNPGTNDNNNSQNPGKPAEAPKEAPAAAAGGDQDNGSGSNENNTIYPVTVTDSFNREISVEEEPKKVISLSPAITEIVFALGQGDKLIGRTDFCDYPQEALEVKSVGGGPMDPNIEKVVELEPDIVFASAHFQEEVLNKLEESNVKVVILYGENSFDGAYEIIEKVGYILNAQKAASKIVDSMKETVADVLQRVEGLDKPSVYYVAGFGEWGDYTAGRDTFIGQLIEMAGAKNAADDVEGWSYSLEKLIEKNPDYLICSKLDNHKEQLKTANGYKDLDAIINDRVLEIDKNMLERQGPRLAEGLKEIAKYIHPEAFE
ncbi:MAG TPA: ABC transporter substrate-binding protein [Clostridiales bacterium]|nr:ABC transporter substrate-binding protein [Clostridiales bacterium]